MVITTHTHQLSGFRWDAWFFLKNGRKVKTATGIHHIMPRTLTLFRFPLGHFFLFNSLWLWDWDWVGEKRKIGKPWLPWYSACLHAHGPLAKTWPLKFVLRQIMDCVTNGLGIMTFSNWVNYNGGVRVLKCECWICDFCVLVKVEHLILRSKLHWCRAQLLTASCSVLFLVACSSLLHVTNIFLECSLHWMMDYAILEY